MRTTSSRVRALRAAPLALLAASCGVGGVLAAAGGGGGGGGGGSKPPAPPSVSVTAPPGSANANLVTISYMLRDPQVRGTDGPDGRPGGDDDPRVRIVAQWQPVGEGTDPEAWFGMTPANVPEHDGDRALPLGQHIYVWNTLPDLAAFRGRFRLRVRVLAEYEDASGITRSFRTRDAQVVIDNRLTGTVAGGDVEPPSDVDTFPVDLRPDLDGFVVADFGANVVERVDSSGLVRRLLGFGVPGDTVGTGKSPGVARLQTLIGVELDSARNLYTNHSTSILVTNQGGGPLTFGTSVVPPFTVVRGASGLTDSRDVRFHPGGALLFLDRGAQVLAFNPRPVAGPGSGPITVAGVVVAPGTAETIAGGGADTGEDVPALTASLSDAVGLAVGPDGEIYVVERAPTGSAPSARVRVVNPGTGNVTVGGATIAPATIRTVAGDGVPGFAGDGGPALAARMNIPSAIDVSPSRALFIADTGNVRVRLVNLGVSDVTFAETTVAPGEIDTVAGGGSGGVGSKAAELQFAIPNAICLDTNGNLLVADQRSVVLVNGGTSAVTSYGRTAGAARTARVYDASRRAGAPLTEPRAVHSSAPTEVYVTDRATVRAMNLSLTARTFGGEAAAPGELVIVGGGAVPGFGGDGGSARAAAFSLPSALATQGARRLWVADTGNDRVRLVNLGDPRLPTTETETVLGQSIAPGNVATLVGGAPGPLAADGDGLAAAACSLSGPEGVAVGDDGLVWVCDTGHHRIRVVNPGAAPVTVGSVVIGAGSIGTVIGTGTAGFTADGTGPWQVSSPGAVTIDAQGIVYFAERGNFRIRCFNPGSTTVTRAGISVGPLEVRTLVGTGAAGNTGDGGDGPSARITTPRSLFVQSRADATPVALYFADEDSHVVRMLNLTAADDLALAIDADGRVTTTIPAASVFTVAGGPNTAGFPNGPGFAGDGEEAERVRFSFPFGVAVTTSGGQPAHFFTSDRRNDRLRRFAAPPLVKTNQ